MADAQHITVDPKAVTVSERMRAVDEDIVDAICAVGLRHELHPIIVRPIYAEGALRPDGVQLVAGGHRLAAAIRLGLGEITAIQQTFDDEQARLVEIEENMVRKGLRGLERARFLYEWKLIYEAKNPEARRGARGGRGGKKNKGEIFPFNKIAAQKLECDPSTVKKAVAVFVGLNGVRARIADTWIADKDTELRALASLDPARQTKALDVLLRDESPAKSVAAALAEIDNTQPRNPDDVAFEKLYAAWHRAGAPVRARFLDAIKAEPTP